MKKNNFIVPHERTAVVTGGTGAIGSCVVRNLLEEGINVISVSRHSEENSYLNEATENLEFYSLDIRDCGSIQLFIDFIYEKFKKVDILVNCAGIRDEPYGVSPSGQGIELWKSTFETNLFGVVQFTNAIIPLLKKSSDACIVNVSSLLGSIGTHCNESSYTNNDFFKSLPAYSASKSALNSYTIHINYELQNENIRVQAVHPGYTKSPLNDGAGDFEPARAGRFITEVALGRHPEHLFISEEGVLPW